MKLLSLLALSLLVFTLASNVFRPADECVRQRKCMTHDFELSGEVDLDEKITLSIAVKLANVQQIYTLLEDIANPSSANYGKWWSYEQVREVLANPDATDAVVTYLSKFVQPEQIKVLAKGGFIEVETNLKTAQLIVGANYRRFHSPTSDKVVIRTFSMVLPTEISEVVDYIFPTIQFPPTFSKTLITSHGVPNANVITPAVLNSYYNITSNTVTQAKATQSLFESLGQQFSPSDLSQFQTTYKLPSDAVDQIIGGNDPTACSKNPNNCAEANLDVQYIMAVAQLAPTTFWNEASSVGDIFYKWIQQVAADPHGVLVHSISYGSIEDSMSETTTLNRFNQEVASLGAQGITVVVSSGDDGVANFGARSDKTQCGFHPSYPATSPYVVAVGATQGPESGKPETACQSDTGGIITTGGGFSTVFAQPSYQSTEVAKFQSNSTACPPKTMFASNGRGYPDVSMAGYNYEVVIAGSIYGVSGTSASAPVFAGVLTLVNNARLKKGKTSVGFVNPSIYSVSRSNPSVFNDVTVGNNKCCAKSGVSPVCCTYGFYCTPGWDPVTGLGSVNVGRFVDALANL